MLLIGRRAGGWTMDRRGFCFEPNNGANGSAVAVPPTPPPSGAPIQPASGEAVAGPIIRAQAPPISGPSPVPGPDSTPAPQAGNPFLQEFVDRGYINPGDYQSPDEVFEVLDSRFAEAQRLQEYAQLGQQFAPHASEFQEFLRTRQQQSAPQQTQSAPQQPAKSKWQAPAFDPDWENRAEWSPEHGKFLPKTAMDHDAAAGLNKYVQFKQQFDRRLATDPLAVLEEAGLGDRLAAMQEAAKQQALAEFRAEQQRAQHAAELQKQQAELFVLDAAGNARFDLAGNPVLTPKGQAFAAALDEAADYGITDQAAQQRYAMKRVSSDPRFQQQSQEPPAPQPQAQQRDERGRFAAADVNEDQKRSFLRRPAGSGHAPNRGAAEANEQHNDVPANTRGGFGLLAQRNARQQGLL